MLVNFELHAFGGCGSLTSEAQRSNSGDFLRNAQFALSQCGSSESGLATPLLDSSGSLRVGLKRRQASYTSLSNLETRNDEIGSGLIDRTEIVVGGLACRRIQVLQVAMLRTMAHTTKTVRAIVEPINWYELMRLAFTDCVFMHPFRAFGKLALGGLTMANNPYRAFGVQCNRHIPECVSILPSANDFRRFFRGWSKRRTVGSSLSPLGTPYTISRFIYHAANNPNAHC